MSARFRIIVALGGILALLSAAVAVALVVRVERGDREELERRFQLRAAASADLASAYLDDLATRQRRQAQRHLADLEVTSEEWRAAVTAIDTPAALLLDRRGRVLHVWPRKPELLGSRVTSRYPHLAAAMRGRKAVSPVVDSLARGVPIVALALPYASADGRRVFSTAVAVGRSAIAHYLRQPTSIAGAEAVLVDQNGRIVRFGTAGEAVRINEHVAASLKARAQGVAFIEWNGHVVASAHVKGTPWTVVLTAPASSLLGSASPALTRVLMAAVILSLLLITALLAALGLRSERLTAANCRLEEQAEALSRFNAVFESSRDAIYAVSFDGSVLAWNPAAEKLYGYRAEEMVGRSMFDLIPAAAVAEYRSLLECVRRDEPVTPLIASRHRRDGTSFQVSISASPIRGRDGEVVGISAIVRDITEQVRREEERIALEEKLREAQRLEALGVLAGGIAHEFNNILVGVLGNASLALDDLPVESAVRERLHGIETAALRAAELTRQMLAYAGKGSFVTGPIDLAEIAQDTLAVLRASISKEITVEVSAAGALTRVTGDATQLRQVMLNLVLNGAEAAEGGGNVHVTVDEVVVPETGLTAYDAAEGFSGGRCIRVAVEDTGSGMDEATRGRIFDPFFTTKFTGRGLGLAAVRGIVHGHGGALRVESTPGLGTTFELLLPAAASAATVAVTHASGRTVPCEPGMGPPVLVVDDEASVRGLARAFLQRLGFEAVEAESGLVALQRLTEITPAAVLLDLTMPGLGGEATLERIRATSPDLPVVLMSGYSSANVDAQLVCSGRTTFISKPFTAPALRVALDEVLPTAVEAAA